MKKHSIISWTALILLIIGGLNWGLALWDINVVTMLLGTGILTSIVYGLVGASALYEIYYINKKKK